MTQALDGLVRDVSVAAVSTASSSPAVSTSRSTATTSNGYVWRPDLIAAGVEPGRSNGMPALRHFYASALIDGGESASAVAEYVGHADRGCTLRLYANLFPSSEDRARRAIDALFGDVDHAWTEGTGAPASALTAHRRPERAADALRHFYASVLIDAGESVRAVADYLGHADPGFTLRVYAHLFPSSEERARKAVDRLASRARRRSRHCPCVR